LSAEALAQVESGTNDNFKFFFDGFGLLKFYRISLSVKNFLFFELLKKRVGFPTLLCEGATW